MSETDTLEAPASISADRPAATKPRTITAKTWQRLTPRQQAYVASYVIDGKALKAYLGAGYVQSVNGHPQQWLMRRAYSVRRGQSVATAILEDRERRAQLESDKQERNLDSIVADHERLMGLAESKGDLAVATRNLELIGRTRGVYADNVMIDVGQRREYSEAERVEAARLSRLLLTDGATSDNVPVCCAPNGDSDAGRQVDGSGESEAQPVGGEE